MSHITHMYALHIATRSLTHMNESYHTYVCIAYCYTQLKCTELSALQHCNDTLQHTALQHAATQRVCCSVLHMKRKQIICNATPLQMQCIVTMRMQCIVTLDIFLCNTLQHTATHCNTLQHTATHCNTLDIFLYRTSYLLNNDRADF